MRKLKKLAILIIAFMIIIYGKMDKVDARLQASRKSKTYKKTLTIYIGNSKKIKAKGIKKAKKISVKNSNKAKLKVKCKKSGYIIIKAKKKGSYKITIKYKSKGIKYIYKIKVKVKDKKGSSKEQGNNNENTTETKQVYKSKYNYDLKVISQGTIYDEAYIYVKTDNPTGAFHFEIDDLSVGYKPVMFSNINYLDTMGKVKEGYVVLVTLEEDKENTFCLYEDGDNGESNDTGIRVKISTGNSKKDEEAYMDLMISKAYKNIELKKSEGFYGYDMFYKDGSGNLITECLAFSDLSEEQMLLCELREMIKNEYQYLSIVNGGTADERIVLFFGSDDKKTWESKKVNCREAARVMRAFAEKIGLKSESTYAGYLDQYYATVTIDGKEWIYDACPYEDSGYIDDNSWDMIDLDSLNNNKQAQIVY